MISFSVCIYWVYFEGTDFCKFVLYPNGLLGQWRQAGRGRIAPVGEDLESSSAKLSYKLHVLSQAQDVEIALADLVLRKIHQEKPGQDLHTWS